MSLKWTLVARLLASWLLVMLGMCVFAWSTGNLSEGIWASWFLGLASLPLVALALIVTLVFPQAIRSRPVLWGSIAVLLCVAAGYAVASAAGAAFAALIAIPSLCLFVGSMKIWPSPVNPKADAPNVT